jgi:sulfatase maturation enzyme AslB (radical SAM superfamily)
MNKSFCVMPFYGAEYNQSGFTTPCCLLPSHTNIAQLQEEILDDKRPAACQKCWHLEDQGNTSDRQLKNAMFDFYTDKAIQFVEEDCRNGKFSPRIIKLYTSNLCNSTCVTCGPTASTAWATLKKIKTFKITNQSILDSVVLTDATMITFVGGEPLYEKKNFELLEKLIEIGNTACFISMTTNGSVELTPYQLNILKQFNNVNLCLSIDGIGPVFEYMRYPLKWSTLLDNIEIYKNSNINLSVSYTISNLNILYYNETIEWFEQLGLPHNHNMVDYPLHFSVNALPEETKKQLPVSLFRVHESSDDLQFAKCLNEIKKQDQLKNISIDDFLPEFVNMINRNT